MSLVGDYPRICSFASCSMRPVAFVEIKPFAKYQPLNLRCMKTGSCVCRPVKSTRWLLSSYACHNRQCTKFCEVFGDLEVILKKYQFLQQGTAHNKEIRSPFFCDIFHDLRGRNCTAEIEFSDEAALRLSSYVNRHNFRILWSNNNVLYFKVRKGESSQVQYLFLCQKNDLSFYRKYCD